MSSGRHVRRIASGTVAVLGIVGAGVAFFALGKESILCVVAVTGIAATGLFTKFV